MEERVDRNSAAEILILLFNHLHPKVLSEIPQMLEGVNPQRLTPGIYFVNLFPMLCLKNWHYHLQHLSFGTMVLNLFLVDMLPENDRFQEFHWGNLGEVPPLIEG